jgi:hypothetical protein
VGAIQVVVRRPDSTHSPPLPQLLMFSQSWQQ